MGGPEPLIREPLGVFLTIVAVIFIAPLLMERVRLPGIVGLILGGILIGPHGLRFLVVGHTIELLATVGLIYLMFNAGLEIDMRRFGRIRNKALVFGLFTFLFPQISGLALGRWLGLEWPAAVLLGSVYASHTLIAFPLVSRLGIVRNEAVSATIGATVFTDVAALLVLALVSSVKGGDVSPGHFLVLLLLVMGYALLVLVGLPRLGKLFFRRVSDPTVEFQFVLVVLVVAAIVAELIGMHAIVGAFLAGLAINSILPAHSLVISRLLFLGEAFFIPIFLIFVGMITDLGAVATNLQAIAIALAFTSAVYITKFLAAWVTGRILRYSRDEVLVAWGLSQAQAAATLATILVGIQIGAFTPVIFNAAIFMILATSITSPIVVQRFGMRLHPVEAEVVSAPTFDRILVAVANPATEEHLITLASILAKASDGLLLVLNVAREVGGRVVGLENQKRLLEAEVITRSEARVQTIRRVDISIARGILHASMEHEASAIVLGWKGAPSFREHIFGSILDDVLWHAHVPVLVGRIIAPINSLERVILVLRDGAMTSMAMQETLQVAKIIAQAINARLLVLTTLADLAALEEQLKRIKPEYPFQVDRLGHDVRRDVAARAGPHDLILITTPGSRAHFLSALGRLPEQLVATTPSSVIVIHHPWEH